MQSHTCQNCSQYCWNLHFKTIFIQLSFNWNHFEMRLLNLRNNFLFIANFLSSSWLFFFLFFFLCVYCFFFHYVSAKFHLWPSSGDLPRPWIGMMSLGTISPVITAFHSCCLSHHVFDQVNLRPAWVPGEHCQKIAVSNPIQASQRFTWSKTWCDRQQLWKAVITGDTVTRLIIPIRGRGKSPEEG